MTTPDSRPDVARPNVVPSRRDAVDAGPFRVSVSRPRDGVVVMRASGPLDMASRRHLVDPYRRRLFGGVETVVFDLFEVSFASSSGIAGLLEAADEAASRGTRLVLVTSPALDRCLRLLELTDRFSYVSAADGLLGTAESGGEPTASSH